MHSVGGYGRNVSFLKAIKVMVQVFKNANQNQAMQGTPRWPQIHESDEIQMKLDEISGGPSASAVKSLQRRFQLP